MYLFDCIEKCFNLFEKVTIRESNNIIKHKVSGMKKISFHGKESHQLHTVMVYEKHPRTGKKIDGGFVYFEDVEQLHNKDIINEPLKNKILKECVV